MMNSSVDHWCISLSNVTMDDKISPLPFYHNLSYSHKIGTTVFSIPSTIIWAQFHLAGTSLNGVGLLRPFIHF